jgi:hypothetical protein
LVVVASVGVYNSNLFFVAIRAEFEPFLDWLFVALPTVAICPPGPVHTVCNVPLTIAFFLLRRTGDTGTSSRLDCALAAVSTQSRRRSFVTNCLCALTVLLVTVAFPLPPLPFSVLFSAFGT